jgi:hypothetical protein
MQSEDREMIIGIDGTGSQGWEQLDLRRTFVRRVLHGSQIRPASYFIGPCNSGLDGQEIVDGAKLALRNGYHNKPVVLVGYSRGAAYCMEVARQSSLWGAQIDVLVMFDAVARQPDFHIREKISSNVRLCLHAYRDPRAGSRYFFQNVGKAVEDPSRTTMKMQMFHGSHGALGGTYYDAMNEEGDAGNTVGMMAVKVDDRQLLNISPLPITGFEADRTAAWRVAEWMWPLLSDAGVLPGRADPYAFAPAFSGSRVPGQRNLVR